LYQVKEDKKNEVGRR